MLVRAHGPAGGTRQAWRNVHCSGAPLGMAPNLWLCMTMNIMRRRVIVQSLGRICRA